MRASDLDMVSPGCSKALVQMLRIQAALSMFGASGIQCYEKRRFESSDDGMNKQRRELRNGKRSQGLA